MNIYRPFKSLKEAAKERKEGYLEAIRAIGKTHGEGDNEIIEFTEEQHHQIAVQFALDPSTVPDKLEMPPMTEMAKNAAAAFGRAVSAAVSGEPVARSEEEQEKFLAICTGTETTPKCEKYEDGRCSICGCFARLKTKLATEHCPIGKW